MAKLEGYFEPNANGSTRAQELSRNFKRLRPRLCANCYVMAVASCSGDGHEDACGNSMSSGKRRQKMLQGCKDESVLGLQVARFGNGEAASQDTCTG
ncbi:hypothetical protein BKA80DRAFT_261644 [Phyllosticta citrichinensis]